MDLNDIKDHWTSWATEFKDDLRATTKTSTIKKLEINALLKQLSHADLSKLPQSILEVGCGNGYNCFGIASELKGFQVDGVDYIAEMVSHAKGIKQASYAETKTSFFEGDILKLDCLPGLDKEYGVVFTNRCIINLNEHALQMEGINQLVKKTAPGGYLLLLENQQNTFAKQNQLRTSVGLPVRKSADFNLFMDQDKLIAQLKKLNVSLVTKDNFASLHDIALYVLLPMINNGIIDYQHPIIEAVTELCLNNPSEFSNQFGDYGQNQLLVFQKQ